MKDVLESDGKEGKEEMTSPCFPYLLPIVPFAKVLQ